jgi:hypothetical protein
VDSFLTQDTPVVFLTPPKIHEFFSFEFISNLKLGILAGLTVWFLNTEFIPILSIILMALRTSQEGIIPP